MSDVGSRIPISVVLCDDHELFRQGLAEMLATADDVEVAGEASAHERAVAVVSEANPDVVLLDLEMPGGEPRRHCAGCSGSRGRRGS